MSMFRTPFMRVARVTPRLSYNLPRVQVQQQRLAHQDYGSGDGNPVGENPQAQGKNPREDAEHPGPPSPNESGSSGSSSSGKSTSTSQSEQSSSSSSSSSSKPQPKILNEKPPSEEEQSAEVRQHNKEMDERKRRASDGDRGRQDANKDKVDKEFWKGHAADKEPK